MHAIILKRDFMFLLVAAHLDLSLKN